LSLIDPLFEMNLFVVLVSLVFYATVLAGWRLRQYEKD